MADKKKSEKKKFRADRQFWVRLLCGFLAALMVLSAAVLIIQMLGIGGYAVADEPETVLGFPTDEEGQPLIAVGLMYADGVTVGFETTTECGFALGCVSADRRFNKLTETAKTDVAVVCDANLSKTARTYSLCGSGTVSVGGWHIQIPADAYDVSALLSIVQKTFPSYDCFPAYINGRPVIRIGCFSSDNEKAADVLKAVKAKGYTAKLVAPSETALSVIDPSDDDIIFEYDGGTDSTLAIAALPDGENAGHMITPAKNTYSGIFRYARYGKGVAVTNILPIEDYVCGVLPWEISNQASQNLLRTFAIAARSFALTSHKHKTFDVCNDTCCQVYKGLNKTNENVVEAVMATAGDVLSYEGKPICSTYSSSVGGCTVAAAEAWGANTYPYLKAIPTPWEDYENCYRGSWSVALTSAQIISRLEGSGYTGLKDEITNISIDELADGSTYVWKITFTDIHGSSVTIRRTNEISIALGLYSANFTVGRPGQRVTVTDYVFNDKISEQLAVIKENRENIEVTAEPDYGIFCLIGEDSEPQRVAVAESIVLTKGDGLELNMKPGELCVLSEHGMEMVDIRDTVLVSDENYVISMPSVLPDLSAPDAVVTKKRSVLCEGPEGTFVFVGRGWGHGVGLSQYGARDLSALGYDYRTILSLYLPDTVIVKYDSFAD